VWGRFGTGASTPGGGCSWQTLSYGGAKMPLPVIERALRVWSQVDFVNAYGLTETSSTVTVLGPDQHRAALAAGDGAGRARLASAGLPVPGIELEIRDGAGAVLPAGRSGEIWVRGDQVSGEYAGRGPMVDARGFFFTRDHGRLDEEGFLFVEGRMDDTIIRGAEGEVEQDLRRIVHRQPGPPRLQRRRQGPVEPDLADGLGQQQRSGVRHHRRRGRVDVRARVEPDNLLHLEGAPPRADTGPQQSPSLLVSGTLQPSDTPYSANRDESPGLEPSSAVTAETGDSFEVRLRAAAAPPRARRGGRCGTGPSRRRR